MLRGYTPTDVPRLDERAVKGRINANLSVGTDVTKTVVLTANLGISHDGVKLHGKGFAVRNPQSMQLGLGTRPELEKYIRPYRNGSDLTQRVEAQINDKYVIDLFGITEPELMERFPEVYQYVRRAVYEKKWNPKANKGKGAWEGREVNNRATYQNYWWIFGEPRSELRPALLGLDYYIGTVDTAKHRIFQKISTDVICDDGVVIVADSDPVTLGVLSSKIHAEWALETGGTLEDRPRYFKSSVFDPFPFPDRSKAVADIAERLDAARRAALGENPALTMTGLYNFVAAIRSSALPPAQEPAATRARAFIVAKLHDDLDGAVADAYGWGEDWRRAPLPPAEIVRRLVALNAERAAEEKAGQIRWLRPDYQIPRFGAKKA